MKTFKEWSDEQDMKDMKTIQYWIDAKKYMEGMPKTASEYANVLGINATAIMSLTPEQMLEIYLSKGQSWSDMAYNRSK